MPSKPLRFLYSKYAGQAPLTGNGHDDVENGGGLNGYSATNTNTTTTTNNNNNHNNNNNNRLSSDLPIAQGRLQRLGREFTKSERINMFFAMSHNNYDGASLDYSSVGSASTNGRSGASQRERTLNFSPARFRSKSQEFQSKYKLAVTRHSPEHKIAPLPQTTEESEDSHLDDEKLLGDRLPSLSSKNKTTVQGQNEGKVMEITMLTRNSLRKSVLPTKGIASHFNLTTTYNNNHNNNNNNPSFKRPGSSNSSTSFKSVQLRHQKTANPHPSPDENNNNNRLPINKIPRCQSRSPADDDRLDSSHYQYLLNDFSSTPQSSVKSDPASSQFSSARAHRPSTTRTGSTTTHRIRDPLGCSMDSDRLPSNSTKTKSRHNSVHNKSPETQWPPRYSIIPSWPSYEDIQTLNSCGDHHNIITQLYRKESRWSRERNSTLIYRNNHLTMKYPHVQQQPIHVVPSHTSMECALCNLYSHRADPTACPPNSPMVNQVHPHHNHSHHHQHHHHHHHQHHDQDSRLSHSYSIHVNQGTPTTTNNNTAPSSVLSKQQSGTAPPSALSRETSKLSTFRKNSQYSLGDSNSSVQSRGVYTSLSNKETRLKGTLTAGNNSKRVTFSGKTKQEKMSFAWDSCQVAYIKANV